MRNFYGVQFLNNGVKSFVIFHQLFQSAEETSHWYQMNLNICLYNYALSVQNFLFFTEVRKCLIIDIDMYLSYCLKTWICLKTRDDLKCCICSKIGIFREKKVSSKTNSYTSYYSLKLIFIFLIYLLALDVKIYTLEKKITFQIWSSFSVRNGPGVSFGTNFHWI